MSKPYGGLEVGLVEAGEPARCRVEERHRVQVGPAILGSTWRCRPSPSEEYAIRPCTTSVFSGAQAGKRSRPSRQAAGSSSTPFRTADGQLPAAELDEGLGGTALELNRRPRAEGRGGRIGQVQLDPHAGDLQLRGPLLGLVAPQTDPDAAVAFQGAAGSVGRTDEIAVVGIAREELRPFVNQAGVLEDVPGTGQQSLPGVVRPIGEPADLLIESFAPAPG